MTIDGHSLANARAIKQQQHAAAIEEDGRRRRIAYERVPSLRDIDRRMSRLMLEVIGSASAGGGRSVESIAEESLDLQAQRSELLVENGFPMDWLNGAWSCPKCRDTGYREGQMCSCLQELYEAERSRELSALLKLGEENFGSFDLTFYDMQPDPESGISPRENMEVIYNTCYDYAIHFGPKSPNLLFRGAPGLGKTFLSACIAREVSSRGHSVVYDTVIACLEAYEDRKFGRGGTEEEQPAGRVQRIQDCELLILDDLGTEMSTEFTRSALYTIINTRLLNGRKTIISTNLTLKELSKRYSAALVSRLEGEYQIFNFSGRDIRKMKKDRAFL